MSTTEIQPLSPDQLEQVWRRASQGDSEALLRLCGHLCAAGEGDKDFELALAALERAADLGSPEAMTSLGRLHCHVGAFGAAAFYFRQAAMLGYAEAMRLLAAGLLAAGDDQYRAEAIAWLKKAEDLGDAPAALFLDELRDIYGPEDMAQLEAMTGEGAH